MKLAAKFFSSLFLMLKQFVTVLISVVIIFFFIVIFQAIIKVNRQQ